MNEQNNDEKSGFFPALAIHAGAVLLVAAVIYGAFLLALKVFT